MRSRSVEMLTLVSLTQQQIDRIAGQVPGGHANIQDIYPLAPLQEGILFHRTSLAARTDAYVLPMLIAFDSRRGAGSFRADDEPGDRAPRHPSHLGGLGRVGRAACRWCGVEAQFELEVFDFPEGDVKAQLLARADPRRYRLDVRQAPMMQGFAASDPEGGRWLLQFLFHHLAIDQITSKLADRRGRADSTKARASELPRLAVPQFRGPGPPGRHPPEHEAFFREMLGDVDEPTAPFGLLDIQGDGSLMREAHLRVELGRWPCACAARRASAA